MNDEPAGDQEDRPQAADALAIVQGLLFFCQLVLGMMACTWMVRSPERGLESSRHGSESAMILVFVVGMPLSIAALAATLIALLLQARWRGKGFGVWFYLVSGLAIVFPLLTMALDVALSFADASR